MNLKQYHPANWTVGTRISGLTFLLAGTTIAVLLAIITITISTMLVQRSTDSVASEVRSVANTVEMFNASVNSSARSLGRVFRGALPRQFALDANHRIDVAGRPTAALSGDGKLLNLDFSAADSFTADTGASATIFAFDGADFVRVSTSVKKEDGTRAVGTVLDPNGAAYAALRAGRDFVGLSTLFGRSVITRYEPVHDASGALVAALYVGVDVNDEMKQLKDRIRAMKVGRTGYFFVLDAAPGKARGELLVHPTSEGENMANATDAEARPFVQQILEQREGKIEYDWQNPGETTARSKFTAFTYIPGWDWVVAGGTYLDEINADVTQLRNRFIGWGLLGLAVLAALLYALMRRTVSRPLAEVRDVARRVAAGDLTARIETTRRDEIGLLTEAINTIGASLSGVVGQVRSGAEQIAAASQQISAGNLDLCQRTEEQASSLASTASSMDQLTATVRQNADNARQAEDLAQSTSSIAQKGGATVAQVIARMDAISQSSRKIADITGVIDGIAFQTNILALNAAVEAARAGEQGRGFAVVAGEVRSLAQRCAAAAKEIKALVDTSNGEVEAGNTLVREAGVTMDEVMGSVARVTGIMAEISAANQEQSSGIEHINQAVGAMDDTTQRNAALVEEASAAAQSLQDQAAGLARAVRLFQIGESPALLQ